VSDDAMGSSDCQHVIQRVYEYLDGELTMWRRVAITRHLDECPPCADGYSFEMELRRVVVSKCHEEVPAELKARIAAALGLAPPGERA
jgi:mycothiol system anti-sigma-R factor